MSTANIDWGGETIVFDTFIDRCRWITKDPTADDMRDGSPRLYVKSDIRDLIVPPDNWEMKQIVDILRKVKVESGYPYEGDALPIDRAKGSYDKRALVCWKWVTDRVSYTIDGVSLDFWQRPSETYGRGKGDCEDIAILLASLLIAAGISPYNVRVVVGSKMLPGFGPLGHAWTGYKTEKGEWVPLDLPIGTETVCTKAEDLVPEKMKIELYQARYCFNRDHVWGIVSIAEWDQTVISEINKYSTTIRRQMKMEDLGSQTEVFHGQNHNGVIMPMDKPAGNEDVVGSAGGPAKEVQSDARVENGIVADYQ